MHIKNRLGHVLLLPLLILGVSLSAYAASEAEFEVGITATESISIHDIVGLTLPSFSASDGLPTAASSTTQPACVYVNTGAGSDYNLEVSTDTTLQNGHFALQLEGGSNADTDKLPLTIILTYSGATNELSVSEQQTLQRLPGSSTPCSTAPSNLSYRVEIGPQATVKAGTYKATVSLEVSEAD